MKWWDRIHYPNNLTGHIIKTVMTVGDRSHRGSLENDLDSEYGIRSKEAGVFVTQSLSVIHWEIQEIVWTSPGPLWCDFLQLVGKLSGREVDPGN